MKLACKLLFQHRVMINGNPGKFRKCEERTVVFDCIEDDPYESVDRVFEYARSERRSFINTAGNKVYFEFVGILDFILLGKECDEMEVWYEYVVKKDPMENRKNISIGKSEMKKKIRQKLQKNKDFIPNKNSNDRSHMNINVDLVKLFDDYSRECDLRENPPREQ